MKPLNILERFANWLDDKFYFNCKKGRHKWGYKLSESGVIYLNEDPPDEILNCEKCGVNKLTLTTEDNQK